MNEKCRWSPTWQQVDDVSWAIRYCDRPIKESLVSRIPQGCGNQLIATGSYWYYIYISMVNPNICCSPET